MANEYTYPDPHDDLSTALIRAVEPSDGQWAADERVVLDRLIGRIASLPGGRVRRLLDAGCGDGRLIPMFAPYADAIVAIDPDAGRLAAARRRVAEAGLTATVQLACTTIEAFAADASFDVVLCSHIIQHVGTGAAPRVLRVLADALTPDGRLALLTAHSPDEADRFVRAEMVSDESGALTYREAPIDRAAFDALVSSPDRALPIRFFADATLDALLRDAGLGVVDVVSFHVGARDRYVEAQRSTAAGQLGGMSIGMLYPVRSSHLALADGAGESRGHFELVSEQAVDAGTRRFAGEFGALGAILLSDVGVRRYRLRPGQATVVLPSAGGREHGIECFVACDTRYGLAIVMVNIHLAVPDVDEAIFLMHGAGGRRDGAGSDETRSIYCVARDCLEWFRADYLGDGAAVEPLTRSPLWCVEVRSPPRGSATTPDGAGADAFIDANVRPMYGLMTQDEGWRYVPLPLARERLAARWGSRDFFSAVALGPAVLMVNFSSPAYRRDAGRQWSHYVGAAPTYFASMNSEIAGLEHGALSALEHAAAWDIIESRCDVLVRRATQSLYRRQDALHDVGDLGRRRPTGKEMASVVDDLSLLQAHVVRDVDAMLRRSISEVNVIAQLVRQACRIDRRTELIKDQAETLTSQLRVRAEERRNGTLALLAVIGTILTVTTLLTPILSGPMQWSADRVLRQMAPAARAVLFYPNKPPDSTASPLAP